MPCYHPLRAVRASSPGKSGKFALVFSEAAVREQPSAVVRVPCGECVGCKLEYSRQWAIRCVHEAQCYEQNCMLTLTYSDKHVPVSMSLDRSAFPNFAKRLRKRFVRYDGNGNAINPVRYFHCGEYGEQFARPHYHAILFNFDFPDKVLWRVTNGNNLYTSKILSELWPFGFSSIGAVTFESSAYVARYVMKKISPNHALDHYTYVDKATGEWFEREPEYVTMSLKPGIGYPWLEKFGAEVFPDDFIVMRGRKMKPPRFYKSQYEIFMPEEHLALTLRRQQLAREQAHNATPERLRVREKVKLAQISTLKRGLSNDS